MLKFMYNFFLLQKTYVLTNIYFKQAQKVDDFLT